MKWILTKLGMCIAVVEINLGLLMDKFRQFLTEGFAHNCYYLHICILVSG